MEMQCNHCKARFRVDAGKKNARGTCTCPQCGFSVKLPKPEDPGNSRKMEPSRLSGGKESQDTNKNLDEPLTMESSGLSGQKESADFSGMMRCPKCEARQPESDACIACGIIFEKYRKALENPDRPPADFSSSEGPIPRSFMEAAAAYVVDHVRGVIISVCIVLTVSFFLGGVPLFSVLWASDDEVMYFTQVMHCNQIKTYPLEAAYYQVILGNTGEISQDRIRVSMWNIPCRVEQVYYTLTNLNAAAPRSNDPVVSTICGDESRSESIRYIATSFDGICGCFPQYRAAAFVENGEDPEMSRMRVDPADPVTHGFLSPCRHVESGELHFEIENLAPGTLMHIGIVSYDYKDMRKDPWRDMKNISLTFEGSARIIEGNPQATAFTRILNEIF